MSDFSVQMYDADGMPTLVDYADDPLVDYAGEFLFDETSTVDSYIDDIDNIDLIKRNRLYDLECPSLEISIPRSYSTTPERNFGIEVIYDSAVVFAGYITSVQEDIDKDIYKLKVDHILYKLKNITLDYTNLHADFEAGTSDQQDTYAGGSREFLQVIWAAKVILNQIYGEIGFGSYTTDVVSGVESSPLFVDSDYNIEDMRFDYQCFWALNQEYALAQSMIDDETEDYYDEYQEKKPTLFDVFQNIAKFLDLLIYFEDGFQINTKSNLATFSPSDTNKWEYKQENIQAEYNNLKVNVSLGFISEYYNSNENSPSEYTFKAIADEAKTNFKEISLINHFFVYSLVDNLKNSDFETWASYVPTKWNYNNADYITQSGDSQSGSSSLKMAEDYGSSNEVWQTINIVPVDNEISTTFYYKIAASGYDGYAHLKLLDKNDTVLHDQSVSLSYSSGSWEEQTITISAGDINSDTERVRIKFILTNGEILFDNISMSGTYGNPFQIFTNYKAEYYIDDYVEEEITAPLAATANDVTSLNLDIKKNERNIKQESGAVTETFPYTLPATLGNRL